MKTTVTSFLGFGLFFVAFGVRANDCYAQGDTVVLTLREAISKGIANSKLLKASAEKIRIAQAKLAENNIQRNPWVNLISGYTRLSDNVVPFTVKFPGGSAPVVLNPQVLDQWTEAVSLSQLLYNGNRVKATAAALELLELASRQDYSSDRATAIFNIITAYYTLFKQEKTTAILQQNKLLLDARIADLENLEKAGIVLHNDVLKLQIQLSQLRIQQLDNDNSYTATRFAFNILLGIGDSARYRLDTAELFHLTLDRSYRDLEARTLANRPELLAAKARLDASAANIRVARSGYYPAVSASTGYSYLKPNQRWLPQRDRFDGTWSAGVTLSWDLSTLYNNRHYVTEAAANLEESRQLTSSLVDNIRTELYTNYLAWVRAAEHLHLSELTEAQARENYRIVNDRLQEKLVLPSDLQDAVSSLIQTQLNVLQDKADLDLAYYRLIKSAGELNQ